MSWEQIIGYAAHAISLLVAGAALWTAYETRRSVRTQHAALEPEPLITATLIAEDYTSGAGILCVDVRNRLDAELTVTSLRLAGGRTMVFTDDEGGDGSAFVSGTLLRLARANDPKELNQRLIVLHVEFAGTPRTAVPDTVLVRVERDDQTGRSWSIPVRIRDPLGR